MLREAWRLIEDDSSTSFVKADTPFFAEMIPATEQGRAYTVRLEGGSIVAHGQSTHTVHNMVVELLAATETVDTGQALALSYVTAIAEILAPPASTGLAPLGEHGARAVFREYEIEPIAEGEWSIVRVMFDVTQFAALET